MSSCPHSAICLAMTHLGWLDILPSQVLRLPRIRQMLMAFAEQRGRCTGTLHVCCICSRQWTSWGIVFFWSFEWNYCCKICYLWLFLGFQLVSPPELLSQHDRAFITCVLSRLCITQSGTSFVESCQHQRTDRLCDKEKNHTAHTQYDVNMEI